MEGRLTGLASKSLAQMAYVGTRATKVSELMLRLPLTLKMTNGGIISNKGVQMQAAQCHRV